MSQTASPDWFVVYKGDDVIGIGTAYECARQLGWKVAQVWNLATPSRLERVMQSEVTDQLIAVRVRGEELA